MSQKEEQILPLFLQLDNAVETIKPMESPFIKGIGWDQNANPTQEAGTSGGTGEGYNSLVQTPIRSNQVLSTLPANSLPAGINKNFGSFESIETDEFYYANWNSEGSHGIYVVDCNTGIWSTVIVDPNLPFTEDQQDHLAEHRWAIRFIYDENKKIVSKFLLFTNGAGWQGWINVTAAIATGGFNAQLFPYWTLTPPHFDRRELLEWAIRPPMYAPQVATIPNQPSDLNKVNRIIDSAIQVAVKVMNTDGRQSVPSPYSLPLIVKSEDYLNNPDTLPKNALFTFDAGSCMTESISIFIRKNSAAQGVASTVEWSDWYLYDTIYKFSRSQISQSSVIGTPYWLRSGPWSNYNYDPNLNTIQYVFDNSKSLTLVDQTDFARIQNDIPQKSWGLTNLGDALLLLTNRRDYDNLPSSVLSNLSAQVVEKPNNGCLIPTRTIKLYAYIGMMLDSFRYVSQVGYINGADTTVRFGGLNYGSDNSAGIDLTTSTTFDLNFADKQAFRCYLKGTPYYSDGQWYQVNQDFSLVKIVDLLDFSNTDILAYVRNVYLSGGYFVCVFTLTVPAGRYIATLGRHNVPSAGDFKNTSTYIEGIANSRNITQLPDTTIITVTPASIVTYSKEMEIDCIGTDVDVWGNGQDMFYIFCPYVSQFPYRFIEGYLQESPDSPLGVEQYPYDAETDTPNLQDDWGRFTDKNGFYWVYTYNDHAGITDVHIIGNINCVQVNFDIRTTQGGTGWKQNPIAYLSDHNNGIIGDCNRVLYSGRILSLDGTIGYSNIAISIKDGATVYTDQNGNFTLIIHNGFPILRQSNIYVNAAGNFLITLANCGYIPLTQYNETVVECFNCFARNYPIPLIFNVSVQNVSQTSIKQGGKYPVGLLVADLAGRLSFVNIIGQFAVPSFIERGDTAATFFQLLILAALKLDLIDPDLKWAAPCIGSNLTDPDYIEWVGDYIEYIDNNGNVVSDPSSAVFCSIGITSLYNYNTGKNFSTLSSYQFQPGDRLRIYDDGSGNLLTGNPIDLKIIGQNYNQAAMTAGILPNNNTVPIVNTTINNNTTTSVTDGAGTTTVSVQTQQNNENITLYVLFDPRLVPLINSTGFWIEIYTPATQSEILQYAETQGFYPIINGEICKYTGKVNGQPTYEPLTEIDLTFWDTYLFSRVITIPNVGDKFLSHPFESKNISDTFGYSINSGGRQSVNNYLAKKMWYTDEVIRSDDFVSTGILNGLGTFRSTNRKMFKDFRSGQLILAKSYRNIVLFVCENDWFVTDYNFQYIFANAQGIQVANLDNNLGSPHQKIGSNFGIIPSDTATFVVTDDIVSWYDRKNQAWVICDYRTAYDICMFDKDKGIIGGLSSYINSKTKAISAWNETVPNSSRFDVTGGIDLERGNLYLTFRPRRNNSNDPSSYGNSRKNIDLYHQETLVFNLITKRFVRFENFTPESYGKMRGRATGIQLVTFAAGIPYMHNYGNTSFNNFYGIQYDVTLIGVFDQDQDVNKIFSNLVLDINGPGMYSDIMRTNEPNSFSYVPMSLVKKKENKYYLTLMRDMNSYFPPFAENDLRSTLLDGKRIFNLYLLFRLLGDPDQQGAYFELKRIYNLAADSTNEKK